MTTTSNTLATATPSDTKLWLPVPADIALLGLGLLVMFAMTLQDLFKDNEAGLWAKDAHSHGPIMLAVALWLLHKRWREFEPPAGTAPHTLLGLARVRRGQRAVCGRAGPWASSTSRSSPSSP